MPTKIERIERLNFPDVDIHEILKENPNRFLLAAATAKRARQIKEGAKPLVAYVPNEPMNHVAIALKEIFEGKIQISVDEKNNEEESLLEELDIALEENLKETQVELDKDEKKPGKEKSKTKKILAV
jgi:DNA-directed RNA polymerase subunit omega